MRGFRTLLGFLPRARRMRRADRHVAAHEAAQALLERLSAHDPQTGEHVNRVACLASEIALVIGLPRARLDMIEVGARLHDIGKLDVPEAILTKPGPLSEDEWRIIHRHPLVGGELLRSIPSLAESAETVAAHHERWDGTGYPLGLTGTKIPLEARIFAIADSIDAMRSDRPYRPGMSWGDVRAELVAGTGSQWDPGICPRVVEQLSRITALDRGCPHGFEVAAAS